MTEGHDVVLVTHVEVSEATVNGDEDQTVKAVSVEVEGLWPGAGPEYVGEGDAPTVGFRLIFPKSLVAELIDGLTATLDIDELINRSSFGTPEAKALRATVPKEVVDGILDRLKDEADG